MRLLKSALFGLFFIVGFASGSNTDNLALQKKVSSNVSGGSLSVITDGQFAPEGAGWDSTFATTSKDRSTEFILDLASKQQVRALILQGDWNDSYLVAASDDAIHWRSVWTAEMVGWGQGLRRRYVEFSAPISAQFLRITSPTNDGTLSLSEFQVYSVIPGNWDILTLRGMVNTPMQWWGFLTIPHVEVLRALLAGFALMLICWRLGAGERETGKCQKVLLWVVLIASAAGWCNFFNFHWGSLVHRHDFYHYYLGSKYSPELSYTRLYECSVVADQEDVEKETNSLRMIRNLETNTIESARDIIAHPERCKSHFTPERWEKFKRDLTWFRLSFSGDEYSKVLKDHGYNATPVWNLAGYILSNLGPATTAQINAIALLDPLLMYGVLFLCLQEFGLWAGFAAIVYFGTNYIASFAWTGGAFLRLDWLFYTLLGIVLLKRQKLFAAGFALVCAGLVRIFPFAFLAGVGFKIVSEAVREKSLLPVLKYKALILGAAAAFLITLPTATAITSFGHWKDFYANTTKHFNTISTNMMGLDVAIAYSPGTRTELLQDDKLADPFDKWKDAKRDLLSSRAPLKWVIVLFLFGLMGISIWEGELWESAVFGMCLIFLIRLSNYDYYFILPLAFFWNKEPRSVLGLAMVAWGSWALPHLLERLDDQYFWATVMTIGLYVMITWSLTRPISVVREILQKRKTA